MLKKNSNFLILILLILILFLSNFPVVGQLDLQEANVIDITFEKLENSQYNFFVTLFHDDDGEEGYADFWQIETLNSTLLGKRILTHAHGTVEFTRSAIITIPNLVQFVVVRGHDIIHEFGGHAMLVDLISKKTHSVDQGSANISLSGYETVFQYTSNSNTSTMGGANIILFTGTLTIILFRKRRK